MTTPPKQFKVAGMATIKHLNVRKEGPEDNKVLAVDVKLEIAKVDRVICSYFDDALEGFLWNPDTVGMFVRNHWLAPVEYGNIIEGAEVQIVGKYFRGCDVKKFTITPRDGGVCTLGCSVTLYPDGDDVSDLADSIQDDTRVSIEGPRTLFDPVPAAQ